MEKDSDRVHSCSALDATGRKLVRMAVRARKRAYAVYSNYLVGCAIEDGSGRIHTGCNVENASYSVVVCAERTAIVKMVSRGARTIRRIVVVTSNPIPAFPCGMCLQAIAEFGKDAEVIAVDKNGKHFRKASLPQLFPFYFSSNELSP